MTAPPIRLVLLGAGGHASDVMAIVEAHHRRFGSEIDLAIADDSWAAPERFESRLAFERIDGIDSKALDRPFVVAIGYPTPKRIVAEKAIRLGGTPSHSLIHPSCEVGAATVIGDGAVLMGCAWLSPRVFVGDHAYVGYGATIGHDTRVGDFASIMPGSSISGEVEIGPGVLVGANATILQGITIGADAVVGAGAVVTSDVEAGSTVVGVPARAHGRKPFG